MNNKEMSVKSYEERECMLEYINRFDKYDLFLKNNIIDVDIDEIEQLLILKYSEDDNSVLEYNQRIEQNLSEISSPIDVLESQNNFSSRKNDADVDIVEDLNKSCWRTFTCDEKEDSNELLAEKNNDDIQEEWYHKLENLTCGSEIAEESVDNDEVVEEKDEEKKEYNEIKEPEFIFNDENGNIVRYNPETDLMEYIKFNDSIFGDKEFANCDWNTNNSPFFNPHISQAQRRKLRTPLTDKACEKTLHRFIISLLTTALERELEIEDNYSYYVFNPYNARSGNSFKLDDFSSKSVSKKIGIKTKLDKQSANIILTCYYVLYNKFKITSDEIIFEDTYREGVLMQDKNFDLATYYDKIATKNPEMIAPLTSIMSECLDLKPFPDPSLQFDVWKITYSHQTKKVVPKTDEEHPECLTIEEIIVKYNHEWLMNLLNGDFDDITTKVVKNLSDSVSMVFSEIKEQFKPIDISSQIHKDKLESEVLENQEFKRMEVATAPSTPRNEQNNVTEISLIDSVINRMTFWSFGEKLKKD